MNNQNISKSRPQKLKLGLQSLARDERGLSTVEYVILLALIAVGSIGLWKAFGDKISTEIGEANTEMQQL